MPFGIRRFRIPDLAVEKGRYRLGNRSRSFAAHLDTRRLKGSEGVRAAETGEQNFSPTIRDHGGGLNARALEGVDIHRIVNNLDLHVLCIDNKDIGCPTESGINLGGKIRAFCSDCNLHNFLSECSLLAAAAANLGIIDHGELAGDQIIDHRSYFRPLVFMIDRDADSSKAH